MDVYYVLVEYGWTGRGSRSRVPKRDEEKGQLATFWRRRIIPAEQNGVTRAENSLNNKQCGKTIRIRSVSQEITNEPNERTKLHNRWEEGEGWCWSVLYAELRERVESLDGRNKTEVASRGFGPARLVGKAIGRGQRAPSNIRVLHFKYNGTVCVREYEMI